MFKAEACGMFGKFHPPGSIQMDIGNNSNTFIWMWSKLSLIQQYSPCALYMQFCYQCWEGYFQNVIDYSLLVTLFKM